MDGNTMEQVRAMLLERWKRIEQSAHLDGTPAEDSEAQAEMIDMAQSLEQIGRDTSLAEQGRRELLAIERALAKLASGDFGSCEDCGEEIPSKRLLVLPEARLCTNCQAYEERMSARVRNAGAAAR